MSETAESSSIAERYATAVFDLARDEGKIDKLRRDVADLQGAWASSQDLRALCQSPAVDGPQKADGIDAVAQKMQTTEVMRNTLRLMAHKGRLGILPSFLDQLRHRIAREKGVVEAQVTSAVELDDDQRRRLSETLKTAVGKDVTVDVTVDDRLIGGMIVQVGSKMIDTSIRSKLDRLRNKMKEAR